MKKNILFLIALLPALLIAAPYHIYNHILQELGTCELSSAVTTFVHLPAWPIITPNGLASTLPEGNYLAFAEPIYNSSTTLDESTLDRDHDPLEFANITHEVLPSEYFYAGGVAVSDLNDDDLEDIVVTPTSFGGGANTPYFLLQDQNHIFARDPLHSFNGGITATSTVLVFDANGDQRPDLFFGGTEGTVAILATNDNGNYLDVSNQLPQYSDSMYVVTAADADFDHDGDIDLLVVLDNNQPNTQPRCLQLWLNDGTGHFTADTSDRIPEIAYGISDMVLFDANQDGEPDIALANAPLQIFDDNGDITGTVSGRNALLLNDGTGFFTDVTDTHMPDTETISHFIRTLDYNGDGRKDLLELDYTTSSAANKDRILKNTGDGMMSYDPNAIPSLVSEHFLDATVADFDCNGYDDVYITCNQTSTPAPRLPQAFLFLSFPHNGSATLVDSSEVLPPTAVMVMKSTTFDYEHDGDPDLLISTVSSDGSEPGSLRLYQNTGDSTAVHDDTHDQVRLEMQVYPNPSFNGFSMKLSFVLPRKTEITVYNVRGERVRRLAVNSNNAIWDGCDANGHPVAAGMYFARWQNGHLNGCQKMVLLR